MPLPALAVTVPGHVFTTLGTGATTMLPGAVGSVSVKSEVSVIAKSLLLPRNMVSVEVPLGEITAGENSFLTVGGVMTFRVADAGLLLLPAVV